MEPNEYAERFKRWLEENTNLSPLTVTNYFYVVRRFVNQFPEPNVKTENINRFLLEYEKHDSYNILTIKAALRKYCFFMDRPDLVPFIKQIRRSKARKNPPSDVVLADLVKALPFIRDSICKDVFQIQCLSGARSIAVWFIEPEKVRYYPGHAVAWVIDKGGETKPVVIPDVEIAKMIFHRPEYKDKKYAFLSKKCQTLSRTEIIEHHYDTIQTFYNRQIDKACERAGIKRYRSHDARRGVIRKIGDIRKAKAVAGHKDIRTTARYFEGEDVDVAGILKEAVM